MFYVSTTNEEGESEEFSNDEISRIQSGERKTKLPGL